MSNHASSPKQPRLSDQLWTKIRAQDMSKETFKAYWSWIRQFILFHDKHHPREMGEAEIEKFLSSLAVDRNLSVSSQDQAFHALLFLYQQVLDIPLDPICNVVRSRKP